MTRRVELAAWCPVREDGQGILVCGAWFGSPHTQGWGAKIPQVQTEGRAEGRTEGQRVGMANRLPQRQRGRGSEQRVKTMATPCPMGPHFMDKYPIQRGQRVKFPKKENWWNKVSKVGFKHH